MAVLNTKINDENNKSFMLTIKQLTNVGCQHKRESYIILYAENKI